MEMDGEVDWEALWLAASGPCLGANDITLIGEIFDRLDTNEDGILQDHEQLVFRNAFKALMVEGDWDGLSEVDDEEAGSMDLDPAGWVEFHARVLETFGRMAWRSCLENVAAVCRILHSPAAPEEEQPRVVSVGRGGSIMSKWFSRAELTADERAACRALSGASGWRCLSCEAEALSLEKCPASLEISRAVTHHNHQGAYDDSQPPPPERLDLLRCMSHQPESVTSVGWQKRSVSGLGEMSPMTLLPSAKPPVRVLPVFPARRCETLRDMLSHRALRPSRKPVNIGDRVIIECVKKGTAKANNLGDTGRVVKIWTPEKDVVKRLWCVVKLVEGEVEGVLDLMLPVTSVVDLNVALHPGDHVEAYYPVQSGRHRGERSHETRKGIVLDINSKKPYLVKISFGPDPEDDTLEVRLSWVIRVEMSAWTQVLRRAPYSTVMFLLYDLRLSPDTPEDRRELEDCVRRYFEPYGRFHFVGTKREVGPKKSQLAVGDAGKILSFDLDKMEAEVLPDRKKHLHLRVELDMLEPNPSVQRRDVAACGPTTMHAFDDDDTPLLAAVKRGDVREVRAQLRNLARTEISKAVLEDNVDIDGNTILHVAAYKQSEDMWRVVWNVMMDTDDVELQRAALAALNDWGRNVLWIALESGHAGLCNLVLSAGASALLESEVCMLSGDLGDFQGGPGMVAPGASFQVTVYQPGWYSEIRHNAIGQLVLERTVGEIARAGVVPGDVLRTVNGKPVPGADLTSSFATRRQLESHMAASPRPMELQFMKGSGLRSRPLHRACLLGRDKVVELLLKYGADFHWHDALGRSAMDRAVWSRNRLPEGEDRERFQRCVDHLVEAGFSGEGNVKIFDADGVAHNFEAPAHWSGSLQMRLEGRFWLHIEDEHSPELLTSMQRAVDRSVGSSGARQVGTKDRRGAVPRKLVVWKVQRIENTACLREYLQRRFVMQGVAKKAALEKLTDIKVQINYADLVGSEVESLLDDGINERYLFHGTSHTGATRIAQDKMRISFAGTGAGSAFGQGIYLAEDCMKCDEYTAEAPAGHKFAGLRPLLLCRVLLGRTLITESNPHEVQKHEVELIMRSSWDSLLADRKAAKGTYREFVIFDEDQVCPDYIIWYRRVY